MIRRSQLVLCIAACFVCQTMAGQTGVLELTLKEAVERVQQYSSDAQAARHIFRSEYWNYQYYRANYLPSLGLTSTPYLDRAINKVTLADGTVKFVEQNMLNTDLSLTLNQNIPLTGGSFFLETAAQRMDMLSSKTTSWQTPFHNCFVPLPEQRNDLLRAKPSAPEFLYTSFALRDNG
ncbi:hypothetical protein EZS27_008975 [termite gut metagenome]|uniref:Uncharacterized protein n=1 Tax=termite gut metagenome TaxID=433724 RepID=A0A5J4SB61_9ZZZZ